MNAEDPRSGKAALIGADVPTVSKHHSDLKGAGVVRDDKRGLQVFYRLSVPSALNFLGGVEAVTKHSATDRSIGTTAS